MGDVLLHEWLIAILVGFAGGICDSLLTNRGFVMPGMRTGSDDQNVYDPGFVGNVLLGGGAGFVAWALSAQPAFSDKSIDVGPIAAAFLAGVGGSEVLASHVKQKYLQGANAQTETALDTSVERERILRDELARKDEEIRRLTARLPGDGNREEWAGAGEERAGSREERGRSERN
jgi:hypothetical protein